MVDSKNSEINDLVEKALAEHKEKLADKTLIKPVTEALAEEPPTEEAQEEEGEEDTGISEDTPEELKEKPKPLPETLKEKLGEKKKKRYNNFKDKKIPLTNVLIPVLIISLVLLFFVFLSLTFDESLKEVKTQREEVKEDLTESAKPEKQFKRVYFADVDQLIVTVENKTVVPANIVYFKLTLTIELATKDLRDELIDKMPQVKDAIVTIVSTKTLPEIGTTAGKLELKDDIRKKINSFLSGGRINDIYFVEYVYQI